jgi:hypothetical protein
MTDNYEYIYKAIIALNNTGVSLIDHGLYTGAIETLKDSMRFMKELVHMKNDIEIRGEATASSTSALNRVNYDTALQAAWRRKSMIHHHKNDDVTTMTLVNVSVISEHDHPCSVYDHLIKRQQNEEQQRTSSLCCVTIDLLPFDSDENNFDRLQQESALILYNLSIAYRCCAKQPSTLTSTASTDYNHISFQLMEYAYTVLCSVLQNISARGDLLMNVSLNLFSIALLILYNLHEMSYENLFLRDNKHAQYNMAYEHIVTALAERFMHTAEEEIQRFLGAAAA